SFSAIVGPNGSGKSNVIDALLFVFGYRASKIRQGKLSELIHSSKNAGHIAQCKVEVHFKEIVDGADGAEPTDVPNSEIVLARTASQNNQSKYILNGVTSGYGEVTALLRSKGVDLDHKRFLILQGEVENISQMKPMGQSDSEVGLLEYLEDIIGTAAYKGQIEEARGQVDGLNGTRAERLHRVKIVEREKSSLEAKKNEAVAFVRTENELTRQKSALFQRRRRECRAKADALQGKYEAARAEYDAETTRHAEFRNESKALEETRDLTSKECGVLEKKAKEAAGELARFEREEVQLQVNRKHIKGKLKKTRDSSDKDSHGMSQLRTTLATLDSDIASGRAEVADLEQRVAGEREALEAIGEGLRGKTDAFTAAIEEKQRELAPWKERIGAHQSRLDVALTELKLVEEKMAGAGRQLEQAKHELRRLREVRVEKAQFAETQVEELAAANEEIETSDKALQKAEGRLQVLRAALGDALRKEEEAKAALGATQSQGKVLKAILGQRDLGRIAGIHGRLGSLGTIGSEYDVAVSSACGGALDNIVVQTVQAGQQCVEFLRANNIGRARFVILDTLRKTGAGQVATPEDVPRLFDLVTPADAKFLPAFYHAMGDTVVARDMEQARRVAYGRRRFRVVTVEGNVLEASGTMSGGGSRIARGAMSSTPMAQGDVTAEAVARLTAAREAAEHDCSEQQTALRRMQDKRRTLQARYDELEALLPKLELELKSVDEQVQMAKRRARDLAAVQDTPSDAEAAQKARAEARIAAEQAAIAELQGQCAAIEADIRGLQEKIMQAGGIRLRAQKAKVDGLQERIATVQEELSRWEVAQAKTSKELVRAERSSSGREAQTAELAAQLEAITAEIDAKSGAALEVKQRCDAARARLDTKREELSKIKDELDTKMERFNEMRTHEAALKRQLDDTERALADAARGINYWSSEHDHLALHSIDVADLDAPAAPKADGDGMDVDEPEPEPSALPELSDDELDRLDVAALEAQIEQAEARLQRTRPNLSVLTEYARRAREFRKRMGELDEITSQRDGAQHNLDDLRTRRLEEFMAGFN
ncbi:Structural maintenance of chromosomes protein 4, partial [Coemansia nantahalensis]